MADLADIATILSRILGKTITYRDNDTTLKAVMGEWYEHQVSYLTHERLIWEGTTLTDTFEQVVGRKPTTLQEYFTVHKAEFC